MELTKEQIDQMVKDNEALKAKVADFEKAKDGDGGNADAVKARKKIEDLEKANKTLSDQMAAHQKELDEKKKAEMSEAERLKVERAEFEAKAKAAEDKLSAVAKESAFKIAALQSGCSNVDDAVKLADLGAYDPANPEASKAFVETFKKDKAYLFTAGKTAQVGVQTGDPKVGDGGKTQEQQDKERKIGEAAKNNDSLAALKAC